MIRLLHISDIHIGTKFVNKKESVGKVLKKAVINAFKRSIEYAITHQLDGVLIAGDLFDGGKVPFHGEESFFKMMSRLEEAKIHTFYTTGNHDPYQNNQLFERLKKYTYIHPFFEPVPQTITVTSESGHQYTVVSAGHDGPKITSNIIKDFPVKETDIPWIGIGHTMVSTINGSVEHGNYMPCSLEDILSKKYDYFALGHIHKSMTLDSEGRIRYAGNIQGRHYKETGEKGGWLIELDDLSIQSTFVPFQDVLWDQEVVKLSPDNETMYDVAQTIVAQLESKISRNKQWIGRLHLEGETDLHNRLQESETIEELEESLCEQLNVLDITIKSTNLKPVINREELMMGDHFLGAFLKELETDPDKIKKFAKDVPFISSKGKNAPQLMINEIFKSIDDALIRKMKK